ncbi:MAG: 2-phospho-L-lactate transferase CofD family protein, partial [Candidatus Bathyarchaeota archaeon]
EKLDFQTYFVKRGTKDEVRNVIFEGSENAKPAPGIIEAIEEAERVVICPSNPILSIAPILSIPTIREQLRRAKAYTVAVSPIIGGKAVKGPADRIMTTMGLNVSPYGVAEYYKDFLNHMITDTIDKSQEKQVAELGLKVTTTNTIMKSLQDSINLAKTVLDVARALFGKLQSDPEYEVNCDIIGWMTDTSDGKINMRDISLIARHFGETDP